MFYCRIESATTVTAHNRKNLLACWQSYGHTGLVKTFKCTTPLTEAQFRRLPRGLREAFSAE